MKPPKPSSVYLGQDPDKDTGRSKSCPFPDCRVSMENSRGLTAITFEAKCCYLLPLDQLPLSSWASHFHFPFLLGLFQNYYLESGFNRKSNWVCSPWVCNLPRSKEAGESFICSYRNTNSLPTHSLVSDFYGISLETFRASIPKGANIRRNTKEGSK